MSSGPIYRDSSTLDSAEDRLTLSTFPACSYLATEDQIRSFELLRLAYFVLKLHKFERFHATTSVDSSDHNHEYEFRCNLLRHAIFQQVVSLCALNIGPQAIQLITACRFL